MGAFGRSWELTKLTFGVIKKDKELFSYPVLSVIFSVVFIAIMVFIAIVAGFVSIASGVSEFSLNVMGYVMVFVMYFGLAFIGTFFATAVVYTAGKRFNGGDATFGESVMFALRRTDKILLWSLVSATVGLILKVIENIAERIKGIGQIVLLVLNFILGTAWSIMTIFVIQGIVYKSLGPFSAVKDSILTLRKTWGESLIKYIGFGIVEFLFLFGGIIIAIPVLIVGFIVNVWLGLFMLGIIMLYFLGVIFTFSIANSVYNTALYVYANTGKVPEGYSEEIIKSTFQSKKKEILPIQAQ